MRDILNILETLVTEGSILSAGEIAKYPARFNKFIQNITDGRPFYTTDGEEVIINPNEATRFLELYNHKSEENPKDLMYLSKNTTCERVRNLLDNGKSVICDLSEAKNVVDANVVENNNGQILLCQEILKTGKNKGTQCGSKIFENNLCKRHINKQLTANI